MEKVAFLNLTINSFTQNNIWKKFIDGGSKDTFNLYLHPKFDTPSLFSDYRVKNIVPTAWGHFSLVEATIELMKAALEDEENEYFTLISDSHFPLYDLDSTVNLIKKRYKRMTFAKHFSFHTKVKSQKVLKVGVKDYKFDEYNAVCQFFSCRRKDVIKFVETFDYWSKYFVKDEVIFADEFYFWAIARELNIDFKMGQATTYSDWSFRELPNGRLERNPRTFSSFTRPMLYIYRKEGFLYARKAASDTVITF